MKKLLLIIFLFTLLISNAKALKIVSLGDSISSGYLLSDNSESFDNLLANTLNAELYEFSYLGMRSDDLLNELNNSILKDNIKSADIIIINIGANDLLDLLDLIDLSKIGIEIEYGTIPKVDFNAKFINNLKNYLQEFFINELNPRAIEASSNFSIIFPSIISKIREYNENVKIFVNNLYNPFFNISIPLIKLNLNDIENISDTIINSFNSTISVNSDYKVIDVYNVLRNNDYLNVNPLTLSFDPHPTKEGHKKIYELYLKELCYKVTYDKNDYYVLKGNTINIKPKFKFGYSFYKWDHDLNNINSDIEIKAIYKFNYLYVIIPIILIVTIIIVRKSTNNS